VNKKDKQTWLQVKAGELLISVSRIKIMSKRILQTKLPRFVLGERIGRKVYQCAITMANVAYTLAFECFYCILKE